MKSWLFQLLLLVISCSVFGKDNIDAFDTADENHDGVLQRREFVLWSQRLHNAVNPFLLPDEKSNELTPVINDRVKREDDEKNSRVKRVKNTVNKFWSGFVAGIVTIWATEIGDKTFFIAAILSMKHDRIVVFAGAIGALIIMTILSVVLGGLAALLLPRNITHYIGAVMFMFFGAKMLYDSREMNANGPSDELTEVAEELEGKKNAEETSSVEEGKDVHVVQPPAGTPGMVKVFSQAFFLTFVAEWGDRSQIATITLSAANDPFGVTLGAVLGHSMCTGLAVVGGKFLASRISEKTVTIVGGVLFLMFALHSFVAGPDQ